MDEVEEEGLLVEGSPTEGFMRMREEGGVFRYIEVFVSRKSVMERLKKSGGREEEDLKDLRRREERRGGRGLRPPGVLGGSNS